MSGTDSCWKIRLCTRFVQDSPPGDLVRDVANAYRSSGGAVAPMLRTLVRHPAFARRAYHVAERRYGVFAL